MLSNCITDASGVSPREKTKAGLSSDGRGMGYIYLITNTINGKRYVGQTTQLDINKRWQNHRTSSRNPRNGCISYAMRKYGLENFKFQIICICFDNDCDQFEIDYIKKFNTLVPNGYNLDGGGNQLKTIHPRTIELLCRKWTEEEKERVFTTEARLQKSKSVTGSNNPNFGRKSVHRKKVGKYDKNNTLIETYESITDAGLKNGIPYSCIAGVCNGRKNTSRGYIWKFLSEDTINS